MKEKINVKAIFFDIDGTLIPLDQKDIPENTKKALLALKEKGIKIVVCIGRHKNELVAFDGTDIPFDAYITMNGQMCLDADMNFLLGNEIDPGEAEILGHIFKAKKIPFMIKTEDNIYMNYVDEVVQSVQGSTNGVIPDISEYHGEKIFQIGAFMNKDRQEFLNDLLDYCDITRWNDLGIDIIPKNGGKSKGIQSFLESNNIKLEETMAFGDSLNDLDMIKYVHIGVAMGNSKQELKDVADYVTDDSDKDGIYKALKHFGVLD